MSFLFHYKFYPNNFRLKKSDLLVALVFILLDRLNIDLSRDSAVQEIG